MIFLFFMIILFNEELYTKFLDLNLILALDMDKSNHKSYETWVIVCKNEEYLVFFVCKVISKM